MFGNICIGKSELFIFFTILYRYYVEIACQRIKKKQCVWRRFIRKMLIFSRPLQLFETASVCRLRHSHFSATRETANSRRVDGTSHEMLRKAWKIFNEANRSSGIHTNLFLDLTVNVTRFALRRGIAWSRVTDKRDDVAFLPRERKDRSIAISFENRICSKV